MKSLLRFTLAVLAVSLPALLLVVALPAGAQQSSQEEINALLQSVAMQRDQANNQAAQLSAKLQVTMAELEKVKKAAEACKPKAEEKK